MEILPRFELKFWATETELHGVLDDLHGLIDRDTHTPEGSRTYQITSLYFDTPKFDFFVDKVEGIKHRVKVRLRRYDSNSDGFIEVKARSGRGIRKYRVPLDGEAMRRMAGGDATPLIEHRDGKHAFAARMILREISSHSLVPAVITVYHREAFMFREDPTLRLTIDRNLYCAGDDLVNRFFDHREGLIRMVEWDNRAILEVKTTGPIPETMARSVRRAGLKRTSISKYCISVAQTRHEEAVEHCKQAVLKEMYENE
ncbi:MAG: polyphosphate polymerase domain-containing protein [Myxococcales bacterium]|nr:polyphosphate polymerase domain-containing protein [Myxococcales bacterium]